jgi:hypothetical protein
MKIHVTSKARSIATATGLLWLAVLSAAPAATPQYQIYDIGVVDSGDTASQGFGVSHGGIGVGRSIRTGGSQAFSWTLKGGIVGLPNLSGRSYAVANSAADQVVVGTAATTLFGSDRLPIKWFNGVVSQLPLPPGETLGDANSVNFSGIAVGSVDAGSKQRGAIYTGGGGGIITATTPTGCFFVTAFGINDSTNSRIVGQGIDPNNAARNVGIVYDIGDNDAFEVGALPGMNGALAFGVSNTGYVVGSSMQNQGSGLPFIWSDQGGIVAIPLATGTSEGSARAVNSAGWVVGNDSSAFSIPFLYDGTATYRLADLIPLNSGWDLSMNTSSSALGISENGIIVGTGVYNGDTHAYAMVPSSLTPTPTPTPTATGSPTCTPGPLWYNGDFNGVNALANEENTSIGSGEFASVYDDFIVPSGPVWSVTSVFSDNLENTNVTGASWEIRQGISVGNGGTLVASGITMTPVVIPTGRSGFGFTEYMIEVTGLNVSLPAGIYWLNVTPIGDGTGRSFEGTTSGANCVGTPCGNDGNSFFNSNEGGANFQGTPYDFSMGVNGTAGSGCGSPSPTPTATATATPTPTPTPTTTATPTATPTATATPTSSATPGPRPTPTPRPRPTPPPRP